MTERIKGLTVLLEPDKRDDDAECIIDAIRMIKGVVSVQSHIADIDHHFAVETVRREMTAKLWDVLNGSRGGKGGISTKTVDDYLYHFGGVGVPGRVNGRGCIPAYHRHTAYQRHTGDQREDIP